MAAFETKRQGLSLLLCKNCLMCGADMSHVGCAKINVLCEVARPGRKPSVGSPCGCKQSDDR